VLFFIQRTCEELAVDAIKTGFLLKGENRDGNTSRLKKRYFVLHPRLLYYFTGDRGSNTPAEILPLEYYSIGELQTRDGQEEGNTEEGMMGKLGSGGSLRFFGGSFTPGTTGGFVTQTPKYSFELQINSCNCFSNTHCTYILYEDDINNLKQWMKALRYKCANTKDLRVFEVPLAKAMENQEGYIPNIVLKTVDYLTERAMEMEGIFRKSGSMINVDKYRELFDEGKDPDLTECGDAHTIASLLKLYLRTLPEPLMTTDLFQDFVQVEFNLFVYSSID